MIVFLSMILGILLLISIQPIILRFLVKKYGKDLNINIENVDTLTDIELARSVQAAIEKNKK